MHGLGGIECSNFDFEFSDLYRKFSRCFQVVQAATVTTKHPPSVNVNPSINVVHFARDNAIPFESTVPHDPVPLPVPPLTLARDYD